MLVAFLAKSEAATHYSYYIHYAILCFKLCQTKLITKEENVFDSFEEILIVHAPMLSGFIHIRVAS